MIVGIRNALHGQLHVLLEVVKILLLQHQRVCKLGHLSLQKQILLGEVLALHLLKQLLPFKVFETDGI